MSNDINFLNHFSLLEDPRISGMISYPLDELLLLTLCGVISGSDGWEDVSFYGKENLEFLQEFLPYENGVPQGQTLRKIFSVIDSDYFADCFMSWVCSISTAIEGVVAIDGKSLRGNGSMTNDEKALHVVSAFAHSQGLVIGQVSVAEKTNEITAIPLLLEKLVLSGAIITIDGRWTPETGPKKQII